MTNLQKTINQAIPVYFNEDDFNKFILPHLWTGSRGPKTKLPLWKVFHYILHILYTGEQWKMLPIENGPDGKPEIHYCRIWMKLLPKRGRKRFFDKELYAQRYKFCLAG